MLKAKKYVDVLLPLKIRGFLSYSTSGEDALKVAPGSWVAVQVRGREKLGVVVEVSDSVPSGIDLGKILPIVRLLDREPVRKEEIDFWKTIAGYYMCSVGEVFKAVFNNQMQADILKGCTTVPKRALRKNASQSKTASVPAVLSPAQQTAISDIRRHFKSGKNVLLEGVTGSGKTEIYIHLALEALGKGESVLYLVPEIAISRQLEQRLSLIFAGSLKVFHSKQTLVQKRDLYDELCKTDKPCVILGTRSAIFLPFRKLGLVIIDEEHDRSYKQEDPAPRYSGRDGALMLASDRGAPAILGSATPSFESLFNVKCGKLAHVILSEKYHTSQAPVVKIIDTNRERRLGNMRGSFSAGTLKEMEAVLKNGGQVLVFRSRRAYSPLVICTECGNIPKCPACNVPLSFHKYNYSLSCHYCGHCEPFTSRCGECGETALTDRGAGTEKLEEELQEFFPDKVIARFDAQTTESKRSEDRMIKDFGEGKIDILVGTQMISKGFDFERLSLVVVVSAESLFAIDDFRSDERARQLLTQLLGRSGRRDKRGTMIIQTARADHPVLSADADTGRMLEERRIFSYPPFVRMITIKVRDTQEGRLWNACRKISEAAANCGISGIAGPIVPAVDRIGNRLVREFWIKLPRSREIQRKKEALSLQIELIDKLFNGAVEISVDVDPM